MAAILRRLTFGKLGKAFVTWKFRKDKVVRGREHVKKAILEALHRKLRSAMQLWREDGILRETVQFEQNEGPMAVENSYLRNRVDVMG